MILLLFIVILMAAGVVSWIAGERSAILARWISLIALFVNLGLAIYLWKNQLIGEDDNQWIARYSVPWVPSFGISFSLALDGLSLLMVLLTFFLGIFAVLISWNEIQERVGFYHFNLLWVLAGITGVFLTMDLFLFYFFWEVMLI